jgi:hypothetical protein
VSRAGSCYSITIDQSITIEIRDHYFVVTAMKQEFKAATYGAAEIVVSKLERLFELDRFSYGWEFSTIE